MGQRERRRACAGEAVPFEAQGEQGEALRAISFPRPPGLNCVAPTALGEFIYQGTQSLRTGLTSGAPTALNDQLNNQLNDQVNDQKINGQIGLTFLRDSNCNNRKR